MRTPSRLLAASIGLLLLAPGAQGADVVRYYHTDAIGNVRLVTDQSKAVVERHDYLPFGEECTTGACAGNLGVTNGQPRRFTGKERDAETGLDYFGARYYGSKIGRFTTVDPVLEQKEALLSPQKWNRYAYVRNNPLRYVDPDGRDDRGAMERDFAVARARLGPPSEWSQLTPEQQRVEEIFRGWVFEPLIVLSGMALGEVGLVAVRGRPDFVGTPDGTLIPVSQGRMREGFEAAGFPSRPATKTAEPGMIHEVPTRYGKTDVRTMQGSAAHPRRTVTTRAGTNDPVKLSGERFRGSASKAERRDASHLKQSQ